MTFIGLMLLGSGVFLVAVGSVPEVSRRMRSMFHGWMMACLGAVIIALGAVPLFQGMPVLNPVLRNAFGWSAGQMSWAFAITRIEGAIFGPFEGLLVERAGPRWMVLIGFIILGSSFLLLSQIQQLWQLYAVFFIMSIGTTLGSWLPMMTLINNWFTRRRSRAMSVMMEGFALGGVAFPLLLAWGIGGVDPNISERFGWRTATFFVGIFLVALAFPLSRMAHNRPADLGLLPDGDSPDLAAASPAEARATRSEVQEEGYTWQEAIRTRSFWIISFGHAAAVVSTLSIFVHMGLLLDDRGFSLGTISLVVAAYTVMTSISVLVGGYLGDRIPIRVVIFVFSSLLSVATVVLVLADSMGMLLLFAVLFGIGFGGRDPTTAAIRGIYFGRRSFAVITSLSMVPVNILSLIGPLFAGYLRDSTGSYDIPFLTIAAVTFLGSGLFLLLDDPTDLPSRSASSRLAAD